MNASAPLEPARGLTASGISIHVMAGGETGRNAGFAPVQDPAEAAAMLADAGPEGRGLLIYTPPALAIARMIEAGTGTPEAIAAWLEAAGSHLDLARKWRKLLRVVQVPGEDAARRALATALAETWGDAAEDAPALPAPLTADSIGKGKAREAGPFFTALAMLAVHADEHAQAAMSELLARSTGPCEELLPIADCTRMLRAAWQERHETNTRFQQDMSRLMSAQIHDLESALQERTTLANKLNKDKEDLRNTLTGECAALRNTLTGRTAERDNLAKTLAEHKAALAARTAEHAALTSSLETLRTARKAEVAQARDRLKAEYDTRQAMCHQLNQQLAHALEGGAAHEARAKDLAERLEAAERTGREKIAARDASLETIRQELAREQEHCAALNDQIAELEGVQQAEAETFDRALETARQEVADARQALAREQDLVQTLNDQIAELESVFSDTKGKMLAAVGTTSGNLREMLISTRDALTEAGMETSRSADMKAVFKHQSRQLETALQMVEEQREALQAQLDSIHGSTSWRLTRPLRSIGRALGR